jgi:secreted effector protein SseD
MMRTIAILLCGTLAACSQTGSPQTASVAQKGQNAKPAAYATAQAPRAAAGDCERAVAKMQKQQMNAAMLGGALSMVGGLGGFAGRGGAVAAQAVSVGGSVMQAKAQNDAQDAISQDCMP